MKFFCTWLLALCSLLLPQAGWAASQQTVYKVGNFTLIADKSTQRITVKDGNVINGYFDFVKNKSYTYQANGTVLVEDLSAVVLNYAGGSLANANQIETAIRNMVAWNPPKRLHSHPFTDPTPCNNMSKCDLGTMPAPNPWASPYMSPTEPSPINDQVGDFTWDDLRALDYADWERWRDSQCQAAAKHGGLTAFGAGLAGAGCAAAATGVGLIGCGGGLLMIVWAAAEGVEASAACVNPYPGLRAW